MKSISNLQQVPAGTMISSDDIIEFHASRILLFISICGTKDKDTKLPRLDGLTKLAKLDFFIRYPAFLERAASSLKKQISPISKTLESKMIRYHYGPWDERYYHVIPYLEARGLLKIVKDPKHNQYKFYLTEEGNTIANALSMTTEFQSLLVIIKNVKMVLGSMTGSKLKQLVYELFVEEVKEKKLGEIISYD